MRRNGFYEKRQFSPERKIRRIGKSAKRENMLDSERLKFNVEEERIYKIQYRITIIPW